MKSTTRIMAALGLATTLLVGIAQTAPAAPPVHIPGGVVNVTFPGFATGCGEVTMTGPKDQTTTVHFDGTGAVSVVQFNGSLKVTLTSVESGRSIDLNISGSGKLDGDQLTFDGPSLIFGDTGLIFVRGRTDITLTPGTPIQLPNNVTALCPILNP